MATIETLAVDAHCGPEELWARVAVETRNWLSGQSIALVDACLLVPFLELLTPARRAFAGTSGWMPRIHTTQSLARECGPGRPRDANAPGPTGDPSLDDLAATRLLRQQGWADDWARRDRPAFDHGVSRLVRTAHLLMQGASALPPDRRAGFWEQVRASVGGASPAVTDRSLLRTAIEWAAVADDPTSDLLFALRPAAWIVVECGGQDALSINLLAHAAASGLPCLRLLIDRPESEDPFEALPRCGLVDLVVAADAEEEARAAAHEVITAISRGATPVALVAEDRSVVRRVRALLERAGATIDDETGWSLATTRAGAHAFSALRAAHPTASQDDWLDWLKSGVEGDELQMLTALEAAWRGGPSVESARQSPCHQWWARERERLVRFAAPRQKSLAHWLQAFDTLLSGTETVLAWGMDPAMEQLRTALRLDGGRDLPLPVSDQSLSLAEFSLWVDRCLEGARFVAGRGETQAQVVLTPLSRAIARPFETVVVPGADEQRLSAGGLHDLLLSDAALQALNLPARRWRQRRQALAFVQLLRVPRLVLVRRRADSDEMLAPSPLIDRLLLSQRGDSAHPVLERDATLLFRSVQIDVAARPLPNAAGHLPPSWSASAVEALRQCPYRFFARSVLRLKEQDELDDEVDKRDYGRWLHATLERFHVTRAARDSKAQDIAHLIQISKRVMREMVDTGEFAESALLPYWAGFEAFAVRYLTWLHQSESQGWRFSAGEVERRFDAGDTSGLRLHGRIDRIDERQGHLAVRLIDYKTSARANLTKKVALPLEDTQLAVYAALMLAGVQQDAALSAAYLSLDDAKAVSEVEHPGVAASARRLLEELAAERARIDAGAPLPALGEGAVCETCEVRGLCRRDHWSPTQAEVA